MTKFKKTVIAKGEKNSKEETVLVSSSNSYYDDCPICRAMKKAEEEGRSLTEKEAEEAFAEANKQQRH